MAANSSEIKGGNSGWNSRHRPLKRPFVLTNVVKRPDQILVF
jgi:hypothetical protein